MQLLAKHPADRIQSAQALGRRLRALDLNAWSPERAEHWWQVNLPDRTLVTAEENVSTEDLTQPVLV